MAFAPARIADPLPVMEASLFAEAPETVELSDITTRKAGTV
jgi:hypothetical protein